MSPLLSILLGLFGIAYAGAIALTPDVPIRVAQVETNEQTEEECLNEHRQSLASFERDYIKDNERRIKELVRNKYPVPQEVTAIMERLKSAFVGASQVTRCEDRNTLVNDMYAIHNEFSDAIHDVEVAMSNAQCLKDNLDEIKSFERQSIKDIEGRIKHGRQRKVEIPSDVTEGVARMKALLAEAKKGTTCEETREPLNEIHRIQEDIDDGLLRIDFLAELPSLTKQITREMKEKERQWKSAVARAKKSKTDLSDLIARGQLHFDELQRLYTQFKAALATGDFEQIRAVMEESESAAQENGEELDDVISTIEALLNAPRYFKEVTRRMKDFRRTAKDMQRNEGINTSSLVACLDGVQSRIDEAKTLAAQRPIDTDALADAFANVEEGFSDCDEVERDLRGEPEESVFDEFVPDELLKESAPAGSSR